MLSSLPARATVWPANVAIALAPAVALIAPRIALGLVLLLAATPFLAGLSWRRVGEGPAWSATPLMIAAGAFGLYLFINATWSHDPVDALGKALLFAAITLIGTFASRSFLWFDRPAVAGMSRAACIALLVALAFLVVEEAFGHRIKLLLFTLIPALRPDPKHAQISGDAIASVASYLANRSIAALALILWPMLLIARHGLKETRLQGIAGAATLIGAAACILLSEHESSILALAASMAVFLAARAAFRPTLILVVGAWLMATMLVVPVVTSLYAHELHLNRELPFSARARVILWNFTAGEVAKRPWLGVGISSTKILDERAGPAAPKLPGHVFQQRTGPHAHNIFLQTWYELGAVGAVLLMALGLAVLAAIARLPRQAAPYALAGFTAAAVTGASSYGMWQPWFMGAYALAWLLMLFALVAARRAAGEASDEPKSQG